MRRLQREDLSPTARSYLARRQADADAKFAQGLLRSDQHWQASRRTAALSQVIAALRSMAGVRWRCMYCLDSEGADIEHFWPKALYPEKLYEWPNLLLCCSLCGRLKGHSFPLVRGRPQLLDPTAENPWDHLDFEPTTGNLDRAPRSGVTQ